MSKDNKTLSRRNVLRATGAATVGALAGCGGGGGGKGTDKGGGSGKPIELLHAWSSGDGADAIKALIEGFRKKHPDVKFSQEPVDGAARKNLDKVIQNRMKAGNPPSTWQAWPGKNLLKFEGKYGDIGGSVWDKDLKNNYLKGPKKQAQVGGKFVTVPLNIHRINNLFYNKNVVEKAGVDPTTFQTPADVLDAFKKVESNTDAVPFAQPNAGWTTTQLWETVLLAQSGWDAYKAFINGNGDKAKVADALRMVKKYHEYYPSDASSISWTEGNSRLMNGKAAFVHQGDWAAGAYSGKKGFKYGTDWDQVTFPGSSGSYALNMDSFPYPANNPSPKSTKTFLSYCGTTDAQIRFNKKKGSIPPRKDADASKLNKFQQDQFDDFTSSKNQPPSIQHGLAVAPPIRTNITDAFTSFIESYNVDKTASALIGAFK